MEKVSSFFTFFLSYDFLISFSSLFFFRKDEDKKIHQEADPKEQTKS